MQNGAAEHLEKIDIKANNEKLMNQLIDYITFEKQKC